MTEEEHALARLEADRNEIETLIVRMDCQRREGSLLNVEASIYECLKQRFDDITAQMQEMQRHTDMEDPPTSPAAYRRWVNRSQRLGD